MEGDPCTGEDLAAQHHEAIDCHVRGWHSTCEEHMGKVEEDIWQCREPYASVPNSAGD